MLCTVQHYSLSLSCTVSDGGSKINKLATVVVMTVVDHHGHLEAIKPLSFALQCFSLWGLLLQAPLQAKLSFWFLLVETLESIALWVYCYDVAKLWMPKSEARSGRILRASRDRFDGRNGSAGTIPHCPTIIFDISKASCNLFSQMHALPYFLCEMSSWVVLEW